MIPQDFESFPVFGTDSSMVPPDEPKYSDGFVFGDVLPAEWLNWFLHTMSKGYNELVQYAYEGFTLTISETPPTPLAPTKRLNVVINGSGVTLTLGNGPFIGYVLPVTAKAPCTVSYTGSNGATSDSLDTDQIINYIWKGGYWSPSSNFSLPVYISSSQTVSPSTPSTYIIDTAGVLLQIADGTYPSCEVSVLAQAACQVRYTGEDGTKTDTLTAGDMASYVWMGTYWKYQSVPVTGIDDNGQPFAYNIDSMVEAGGVINITGTDANGNPFDYGLGRLVTAADSVTPNKVLVSDALGNVSASACPSNLIGGGTAHYLAVGDFKSGFSGTVIWWVTNGICTVSLWPLNVGTTGIGVAVTDKLPKSKVYSASYIGPGNSWTITGQLYIEATSSTLKIHTSTTGNVYGAITYQVADDWVEI